MPTLCVASLRLVRHCLELPNDTPVAGSGSAEPGAPLPCRYAHEGAISHRLPRRRQNGTRRCVV